MSKYLIINADDFGVNKSVNEAIVELLDNKCISSTSLMPNTNYYDDVASWSKNRKDVGVHLTFVNDDTLIKHRSLSKEKMLEDENGYLYEDVSKFRTKCSNDKVIKEVKLQIKKMMDDGINISHVDSHRYAIQPTVNPGLFIRLCNVCNKYGKLPLRWARNGGYFAGQEIRNLCDSDRAAKFFSAIGDLYSIPMPDYVFIFPYRNKFISYNSKKEAFLELLKNLPDGISEVHIHPSIESDEIKKINCTWKERICEYRLMQDVEVINFINDKNIEMISYSDISKFSNKTNKCKALYSIFYYGGKYLLKKLKMYFSIKI
ncbi:MULTISPECIES: ChbG/HpnK family deacetylase [unclassified Clostridium]|uniref:ChbG/HpnK family deacetylase n=1 Tax=unclassified Clostridium TaxID=2614128 RepID=UPI003216C939